MSRGGVEKESTQPGQRKSCEKLKCDAVRMTLGSEEEGLVGQGDAKRASERKRAKVS